jgi:predicted O-linked N-acetylglucosamine transferase (SPINDLY family)
MYNNMDIMLDSWPYCGTITSVECLMMGVPIVTLQVFSSFEFRRISLLRARLSLRASRLLQ